MTPRWRLVLAVALIVATGNWFILMSAYANTSAGQAVTTGDPAGDDHTTDGSPPQR